VSLPGCVSGERILGVAMTEPGTGSDLAGIRMRAEDRGDHWLLNGAKTYISNGQIGNLFVVAARTVPDRRAGIGLFLVESSAKTNFASLNGTIWFPLPSGSQKSLYTMTFANGTFVALDHDLNSFTSTDGTNWIKRGSINSANLQRPAQIAYGSGHVVTAVSGFILFTRDATRWTVISNGYFNVGCGVAYVLLRFGSVNNRIIQSDPLIWLD